MRVLLFDAYAAGHHREYASELADALTAQDSSIEVEFLALAPDDHDDEYFDGDEIHYLYDESPLSGRPGFVPDRLGSVYDYAATEVLNPRWDVIGDAVDYVESRDYDLVHVLEIDKLAAHLSAQLRGADVPPIVGTINGVFFKPVSSLLPAARPIRWPLRGSAADRFVKYAPPILYKGRGWKQVFLRRCLDGGALDHVFVHAEEAQVDVATACGESAVGATSVVPDPLERWDGSEAARRQARRHLDLPLEDTVLLFFGQMREEKGIRTLLDALDGYDGESLTAVLAGPPSAVTAEEVSAAAAGSTVDVVSRLEFVPESDVRACFQAADGVLVPYHRSFGAARTSGVFQKACGTGRPVVASDFGVFGRRVRQWDLGLTCAPGDSGSLARAIETFVERGGDVSDPESTDAYARTQTYDRLAEETCRVYRRVTASESESPVVE